MNIEAIATTAIRSSPATEALQREPPREAPLVEVKPAAATSPEPPEIDRAQMAQVVDGMNSFLAAGSNHIQFALHEASGKMMVSVIDDTTKEVIRSFPSKELLDLASKIGELVGTLMDKKG